MISPRMISEDSLNMYLLMCTKSNEVYFFQKKDCIVFSDVLILAPIIYCIFTSISISFSGYMPMKWRSPVKWMRVWATESLCSKACQTLLWTVRSCFSLSSLYWYEKLFAEGSDCVHLTVVCVYVSVCSRRHCPWDDFRWRISIGRWWNVPRRPHVLPGGFSNRPKVRPQGLFKSDRDQCTALQ